MSSHSRSHFKGHSSRETASREAVQHHTGPWVMLVCLLMIGAVLFVVFDPPMGSVTSLWPILLVLLCPLLHFVMHRNHGSSHAH